MFAEAVVTNTKLIYDERHAAVGELRAGKPVSVAETRRYLCLVKIRRVLGAAAGPLLSLLIGGANIGCR